jgi:hypothetical protein
MFEEYHPLRVEYQGICRFGAMDLSISFSTIDDAKKDYEKFNGQKELSTGRVMNFVKGKIVDD